MTKGQPGKSFWRFPSQDQYLTELLAQGLSFSQVGRKMGCSRNAALSRARRLGIQSLRALTRFKPGARPRPTVTVEAPAPLPPAEPPIDTAVSLLAASSVHCRWPLGEPASGMMVCGAPPFTPGEPYCEAHARKAYNPGARKDLPAP